MRPGGRTAVKAACAALALGLLGWGAARAEIVEEVAAFVNGQIITRSDLLERDAQVTAQLQRQFTGDDLQDKLHKARSNLLTDMIREDVLLQRAEVMGLDLDRVYKQALENLKAKQGIKTNDEMMALLHQEGLTEDDLRQMLLKFNVPDIMINLEVREKISVSETEIEDYFTKHRDDFRVEETYTIREIVLLSSGHTQAELDDLTKKVQADMAAGTPFKELVLKYSEAPSRFQEGLVGPLRAPDIAKDLREALRNMKKDDVAGPIVTPNGVHFVQLDAKTEAKEPVLDDVRKGIEDKVKQEKFKKALEDYWKMIYKENRIKVVDKYKPFAEDVPDSAS